MTFTTADGRSLHGDLVRPEGEPVGAAIVCHPHPAGGGTMDSWMIPVIQRALVGEGWLALRFDFRGVRGSEGSPGDGTDEVRDVAAALDLVTREVDGPVLLAGWSFGANVSLRAALEDERVDGWLGVGTVLGGGELGLPEIDASAVAGWARPVRFVHGSVDAITPLAAIRELVDAAGLGPDVLHVVEGGDHFLAPYGDVLRQQARELAGQVREARS